MARALFLVIESRDRWWVDFEGVASGPFETIQQAAIAAQHAARSEAGSSRRQCDVMAPGGDGRFWRIWSSAQDRTPAPDPEPRPEPAAGAQEEQEQPGDPEPSSAPEMGDAAPAETEAAE